MVVTRPATEDIIRVNEQYYVLASSSRVDDRTRVLKHGETMALMDRFGDMAPIGLGELGIFHRGTRHLSQHSLSIEGARPLPLSSTVAADNSSINVNLTNPDLGSDSSIAVQRGMLHIARDIVLWDRVYYQRLTITNYGTAPASATLLLTFEADFVDMFEVRGVRRARRGHQTAPRVEEHGMVIRYDGLDGIIRETVIQCAPAPTKVGDGTIELAIALGSRESVSYLITVTCEQRDQPEAKVLSFGEARRRSAEGLQSGCVRQFGVETSNTEFNDWLNQSGADLHLMMTDTQYGRYPYAGVPWFNAPFGRDGIISALETLWICPDVAEGVLNMLAATQASAPNDEQDAQPGKVLHESRLGEMANLKEVPFGRYYGSVDATPLFVMLAGAHLRVTGDREVARRMWPHVERALHWMDTDGDADGDGFVEYFRRTPTGLANQGWKDSGNAVFHADGRLAEGPIALVEVQGYVYAARRAAARLAQALGNSEAATTLMAQASKLRKQFDQKFWCDDIGTYALALDGDKKPCRVVTSNPGHCLYTGIVPHRRADGVVDRLMSNASFCGWGIRTVASTEFQYNPMSYHNGSVWPHDNAIIAAGLGRYGHRDAAIKIVEAMFDASQFVDLHRLPELFCGFERQPGEGPTLYPVACSPQAWASAAPFLLLQAILGLSISATPRQISFQRPSLPTFLQWMKLRNLPVGDAAVDLVLDRRGSDVAVHVERRTADVLVRVIT